MIKQSMYVQTAHHLSSVWKTEKN